MKVAHLVSRRMYPHLANSFQVHALPIELIAGSGSFDGYRIQLPIAKGEPIKGFHEDFVRLGVISHVNEIVVILSAGEAKRFFNKPMIRNAMDAGIQFSVMLSGSRFSSCISQYKALSKIEDVYGIVFPLCLPCDGEPCGFKRFKLIRYLVENHDFNTDKRHRLYEVANPAEIVAYRQEFTDYTWRALDIVISSMCYDYSLFGASFSKYNGLYHKPLVVDVIDHDWAMTDEQLSLFYLNKEIIEGFGVGIGGNGLMEKYLEYSSEPLNVGGVRV